MVREIIGNNDVTIPACSALHRLDKSGELENPSVNPATFCPTINVSNSGVVNVVGNRIENHYVIKKTAVTLESNQNTLTAVEKIKNFIFGDRRKRLFVAFVVGFCVLVGAVVGIVYLTIPTDNTGHAPGKWYRNASFEYVTKDEWHAVPSIESQVEPLNVTLPKLVIISHTALESPNFCFTRETCIETVLEIQTSQISSGKADIPYNFLIGGDGRVYEGRGWEKTAAHTLGYNFCSIGLALIGNFINTKPTSSQVATTVNFLNISALSGFLDKDYTIFGQNQVVNTLSPGRELIRIMETWKHWAPFDGNNTALDCYQLV